MRTVIFAVSFAAASSMPGCVSSSDLKSHEVIGNARPPISLDEVELYLEPPSRFYESIAVLYASSRRSWTFTAQSKADLVIQRLKEEAASLGANGVLLHEIADGPGMTIGADARANQTGPRGNVDIGLGVSALTYPRYGRAIAIFLPP